MNQGRFSVITAGCAIAALLWLSARLVAQGPPAAPTGLRLSGDSIPPSVSITTPTPGTTLTISPVTVSTSASDDVGVVGVQFKLDGANLGTEDTTSPYTMSWTTTTVVNGSHTLTAVARDAAGNQTTSGGVTVNLSNVAPPPPTILWSADHEEGNMSDWYKGVYNGGREINSGSAASAASTDFAHTGKYSAKATITAPSTSAVRLFRFTGGTNFLPEAYYSAWYYFPRIHQVPDYWIIFQYKSGNGIDPPDPFWYLKVGNRANGTMYTYLQWWPDLCSRGVQGPHQGQCGAFDYQQTLKDLPVGQWVHIEAYLRRSSGYTGQIIVWQDGVELFNQNNVKTSYPQTGDDWAPSSYSNSLSPSPATIYIDDAAISTARLGPGTSDSTPPTVSLSAPAPGATISSTDTVSALASDDVGVTGVQFKIDGANWGAEDTTAPFSISWNSALASNGAHSLSAVARDAAGNTTASAPVSVTISNTATSCQTSGASWQNQVFAPQIGNFTAQFDATPGAASIDGVAGLASGIAAAYADLAATMRFNTSGTIDARNGGAYSALASIPYLAGTTYGVRMVVNVSAHTYSVYVTPSGGSEQALGLDYAFRPEQAATLTLSALGSFTNGVGLQLCNFTVTP